MNSVQEKIHEIEQQLQASDLESYITLLQQGSGNVNAFIEFAHHQDQGWENALHSLGVQHVTPNAVHEAIQQRLAVLNTAVHDVTGSPNIATEHGWQQLIQFVQQHTQAGALTGLFIKEAVLANALRTHPPQTILRHLGYATIDECLASESVYEILAALRFAESSAWMDEFISAYSTLAPDDFEERPVQFLMLNPEKWWSLAKPFAEAKKHHFSHLKEAGVIFSYPAPLQLQDPNQLHIVIMMVLHYVYEVKFYSNFFATHVSAIDHFGDMFIEVLQGDKNICTTQPGVLPIIQQYHLKKPNPNPCVFQPHVMPEVLHWHKARTTMFSALQSHANYDLLSFWDNCYTVGRIIDNQLITFNFPDNILSNQTHLTYHYQEDLWNTLFTIHYSEEVLEKQIITHFIHKAIRLNQITA